jgi:hypothetical protein
MVEWECMSREDLEGWIRAQQFYNTMKKGDD